MPKKPETPLPDEILTVPPFGFDVSIFQEAEDWAEWRRFYDPDEEHEPDGGWGAGMSACRHPESGKMAFALFIPEGTPDETLAHEAVHLSWFVLDTAGVLIHRDNHEIQSYLVGWIVRKLKKLDWL